MRSDVRRNSSRTSEARRGARRPRRDGMTLLELILALALSVLVLGAVTMAIGLFLRTLDSRRSQVEETQIARAVLRMIADDLHGAIQQEKLDFTQAGNQASSAGSALADASSAAAGGAGNTGSGTGASGAGTGSGASGNGTSGGSTKSGGSTSGGQSSSGSGSSGGGGSGGGGSGGSSGTGAGANTGSSPSGGAASGTPTDSGDASQNIDQATTVPPVPGIFGNQYQLQVDISRIPRIEELMMRQTSMDGSAVDMPSDMKTVAYYVRTTEAQPGTGFSAATAGSALGKQLRRPGLVRRQMDRAVTMYASQSGRTTDLNKREQLVAPEVVGVEFRYFDGTQWLTSWDSIEQNRLPSAIEIIVAVQPGGEQFANSPVTAAASSTGAAAQAPLMFRQLVRLPAARSCPAPAAATTDDGSTGTDSSTGAGSGSSGGSGNSTGS